MRPIRHARHVARFAAVFSALAFNFDPVSAECAVHPQLRGILNDIEAQYGPVKVTSVCGGRHAKRSYHYRGQAVDFRVYRNASAVSRYLRANVPGSHHYGGGLFHIDTGPRRPWNRVAAR